MPTIVIHGTAHSYDLTPQGRSLPVLVFIHGWLLSRCYWQPLIDQLIPEFCCLSYDLRGFGASGAATQPPRSQGGKTGVQPWVKSRSPASGIQPRTIAPLGFRTIARTIAATEDPPPDYSPQAYSQDLLALLDHLNIGRAWLVGHSLGGEVALWSAATQPDRIQGVTCLGVGGGIYLREEFERFRHLGRQLLQWRSPWLEYVPGIDRFFARANVYQPLETVWGQRRLGDFLAADEAAALGTLLGLTAEAEVHRLPQLVAQLSQPAYFLGGREDTIMEPQYVCHLASFHPLFKHCGCNFLELPHCGHLAMLEQTTLVANQLRQMLQ
ncbi:alpha/beta fold hydrolase [Prochlorothrix hollandica]|uniref:Esterase n=1 Tax=Prochlorothrix hollandica PCC 9006 = CALU 1027 TaxID=317619 RepID=A0A0M2Q313_PROHO|nr:alpha/beta hydrolase [Prochlorothrix hollandica]KKJ01334.1 esterase [Prochlorothrix hollandica PCC 9006 = CALU 1027]